MFKGGEDSFSLARSRGTSQLTRCVAEVTYALPWTTSRGLSWSRALHGTRRRAEALAAARLVLSH